MKYEAKNDGSGNAVSVAAGTPYTSVTQPTAVAKSTAACSGCHLVTEAEWMTIAANIISVPSNWSGGAVGSGYIYRGHGDSNPASTLAATTDDNNSYYGTGNSSSSGPDQRRTLTLTNGQVIWDFAGNAWEWTGSIDANMQPGFSGESAQAWKEWNNPSLLMNGLSTISRPGTISAQVGTWSSDEGIGRLQSNYGATSVGVFVRGGSYGGGTYNGILALSTNNTFSNSDPSVGFRVAK
jgi:formylglycine-generating enzyme required for sulfatase activity